MFKKNPNRPQIIIPLKKVHNGFKVVNNESFNPFGFKRITRAVFRSDLYQGNNANNQGNFGNINSNTSIVQAPLHITIPSFSRWFEMDKIHQIEKEQFSEFFLEDDQEGKIFKKSPQLYKFYRNYMITLWRENSKKHLSPGVCRKNLSGDVSCIMRIHAFLQHWGLINFPSKQHAKGFIESPSQNYFCAVCQSTSSSAYYLTQIEPGTIFEICDCCFFNEYFPKFLKKQDFKKLIPKVHEAKKKRLMSSEQLKKLLDLICVQNQRERQMWANIAKQFPNFTKEQIMMNFLQLPAHHKMNCNIFQSSEDVIPDQEPQISEQPTIFQDYQNPQQTGIAISYYQWKSNPDKFPSLDKLFKGAQKHSDYLAEIQRKKINQMIRMLTDLQSTKLELKTVFLQQYEKLLDAQEKTYKKVSSNLIAQMIKTQSNQEQKNQ